MNNYPYNYNVFEQYEKELYMIRQDMKRLERRLLSLEKNSIENNSLYNINPTPMVHNKIEAMNNLYTRDNYII